MDEYELAQRVSKLPERFAARLPEPHLRGARLLAEGGEWQEVVDNVLASLRTTGERVEPAEREELAELARACKLPDDALDGLNIG